VEAIGSLVERLAFDRDGIGEGDDRVLVGSGAPDLTIRNNFAPDLASVGQRAVIVMVISVMPMRWLTRACWLARGRLSIRVSLVAVWAGLILAINKTLDNKVSRRTRCMEEAPYGRWTAAGLSAWLEVELSTRYGSAAALRRIEKDRVSTGNFY
jgi:hypothetical protein